MQAVHETFELQRIQVAAYFRYGGQGAQVGGDWYDVLGLPDGRTVLVVGDVMGRGARAALVMSQLRRVVRTYTLMGVPPLELMGSLDHLVVQRFPQQVVTCLYAVFDPVDLSLRYLNAGHVPPLLIHPDGTCTRMTFATHPPLGVGQPFEELHRVDLTPGAGVVLYTDGLVECRGQEIEAGIESLRRAVAALDVPLRDVPEALVKDSAAPGAGGRRGDAGGPGLRLAARAQATRCGSPQMLSTCCAIVPFTATSSIVDPRSAAVREATARTPTPMLGRKSTSLRSTTRSSANPFECFSSASRSATADSSSTSPLT